MKVLHILALAVMDFICGLAFLFDLIVLMHAKSGNEIYTFKYLFWIRIAFVLWTILIAVLMNKYYEWQIHGI
jgi:hypothetical protein